MSARVAVKSSSIIFSLSLVLFSLAGQAACTNTGTKIQAAHDDRAAIAGILLTAPQRQIHTKAELDEVNRRVKAQGVSPEDFRSFLQLIIRMRLEIVQGELDQLSNLHKALSKGAGAGFSKEDQQSIDMTFSQCEMPLITKQLLERELYALEAWKPNMSAEQALALADQRQKGSR